MTRPKRPLIIAVGPKQIRRTLIRGLRSIDELLVPMEQHVREGWPDDERLLASVGRIRAAVQREIETLRVEAEE